MAEQVELYRVVIADPPWSFGDKLTMSDVKRGAEANYGTMRLDEICALPVRRWVTDDALLALWIPSSLLSHGMLVLAEWGFKQKQIYTWVKTSKSGLAFGMGRYFRGCTEHALIGTRGKLANLRQSKRERCADLFKALPHSRKPDTLHERLERMLPGPYLELFARRSRPGWTCVGNECPDTPGQDIRTWSPFETRIIGEVVE